MIRNVSSWRSIVDIVLYIINGVEIVEVFCIGQVFDFVIGQVFKYVVFVLVIEVEFVIVVVVVVFFGWWEMSLIKCVDVFF